MATLSTSTSTIAENDNVLKYCVKYFKQYLSTNEVPKLITNQLYNVSIIVQCICIIASDEHQLSIAKIFHNLNGSVD